MASDSEKAHMLHAAGKVSNLGVSLPGALLVGTGIYNSVEAVIDNENVLQDAGYTALGVGFIAIGYGIHKFFDNAAKQYED